MSLENPCDICGEKYDYNCESCPNCTFKNCNYCSHEWFNTQRVKDNHEKDCYWYDKEDDLNAWL